MEKKLILTFLTTLFMWTAASAQKVSPTVEYINHKGEQLEVNAISEGQAPLNGTFRANPTDIDEIVPSFEWHFYKTEGSDNKELFVRYEEDTEYTFNESGTYNVFLKMFDEHGEQLDSANISVTIVESWLDFPNAFSPNNDGLNDEYKAKKDYRSIVEFRGIIINRWGQKLFEWTDLNHGWDGTYKGKDVKEGVYFFIGEARGADGKEYHFRKDVNLLRSYTEGSKSNGTN